MAVYALSYDPVVTLRRFADAHGITYPLLADVGSATIERLGLLNVTIEAERAAYGRQMEQRHYGLPYPGTFSLDEDGVVIARHFEQSHRVRPTANTLLSELTGEVAPAVSAEAASEGIRVAAWLGSASVSANQLQDVTVALDMDEGVHVYVPPVPEGFTALAIEVDADVPMQVRPPLMPEGHEFRMEGLDEEFRVIEGAHQVPVPFYFEADRDTAGDPERVVELRVRVRFQACTDEVCFIPESVELVLPTTEVGNPEYEELNDKAIRPLMIRRLDERPMTQDQLYDAVAAGVLAEELPRDQIQRLLAEMSTEGLIECDGDEWRVIRPA